MKSTLQVVLTTLLLARCAIGHGYVSVLDVEGTSYASFNGDEPTEDGQATQPSVIRRISTIDPVKGASNAFLNCGQNATAAALIAPTQAGDALALHWEAGGGQGWPHNIGPLMFYLANCGSTPCSEFDSTTAQWFKISEVGLMSDNVTWYQANLKAGGPANVTLPSNIAPGNYLLRHEIIALHLANTQGGAEFYPSCLQLNITGSGNGKPASSELVSFPGAYKDTDPGIYVPDIFNGPISNYAFPGPAVAAFISGSNSSSSPTGTSPAPTSTAGLSQGKCRLVKQPADGSLAKRNVSLRRHLSGAVRRLLGLGSF